MKTPIVNMEDGKKAIIIKLVGGPGFQRRMRALGIREGKTITVITRHPFGGPLVVEVDNRNTTVGRRMAQRIIVEG